METVLVVVVVSCYMSCEETELSSLFEPRQLMCVCQRGRETKHTHTAHTLDGEQQSGRAAGCAVLPPDMQSNMVAHAIQTAIVPLTKKIQ